MERPGIHFLLVEDDSDHAEIILFLMREHFPEQRVTWVENGADALAFVRGEEPYEDREEPDVIMLDLKLPRMNGHEVLEAIKQDPVYKEIPIIVLTTSRSEADRKTAYQNYVNSYLVKPIRLDDMEATIRDLSRYWGRLNQGPS